MFAPIINMEQLHLKTYVTDFYNDAWLYEWMSSASALSRFVDDFWQNSASFVVPAMMFVVAYSRLRMPK